MRPVALLGLALPFGGALAHAMACGDEEYDYGSSRSLGDPSALFGTPVSDGGGEGAALACTPDRYVDGSACSVSFKTDLFAGRMGADQPWHCASASCHGGASPPSQPPIDSLDASAAYASLVAYTIRGTTLRYINPCATDLKLSGFACNLHFDPKCGVGMPSKNHLPNADLAPLETWIACGSPLN